MFRHANNLLKPHFRRLHPQASYSTTSGARRSIIQKYWGPLVSSSVLAAYILWYSNTRVVHNDAVSSIPASKPKQEPLTLPPGGDVGDSEGLHTVVWGSNRSNTLIPDEAVETIRAVSIAKWLDGVALRDMAFHRHHAACVDARGDVYQWGSGFSGSEPGKHVNPTLTLRNKNIIQLKLTEGQLYALSASGKVYSLATNSEKQKLPAKDSTRGSWWLWGKDETVDFVEVTPKEALAWGERFVSIEAGNDHVLALTSKNRVFSHPVNKNANAYGQLGFRKFKIADPATHDREIKSDMEVELIPKFIADPYAKSTRSSRSSPRPTMSDNLVDIDDSNIRFCPHLFEIPVLRGVEIVQVAAGGRSSFARTATGRVLGWGANEYGQIGLGSNVVADAIVIPTEVILWRTPSARSGTKCLDITGGGDLTAFVVEHVEESSPRTIELLMCGNGQWGGLGSNTYSNAQSVPMRAKNVSGLLEYSEITKSLQPIVPHAVTISPTGHVFLTLDTSSVMNVGGKDLVVWGKNYESELGNGRKSSVSVPTTLETPEGGRFMLKSRIAREVRNMKGDVWGRKVNVEQQAVVGFGNSAVYWKICK